MELMDNPSIVAIPGAMDAGLTSALFWGSQAGFLVVAFIVTTPGQPVDDRPGQGPRRSPRLSPLIQYRRCHGVRVVPWPSWWLVRRPPVGAVGAEGSLNEFRGYRCCPPRVVGPRPVSTSVRSEVVSLSRQAKETARDR
jgi:hypothetical protein